MVGMRARFLNYEIELNGRTTLSRPYVCPFFGILSEFICNDCWKTRTLIQQERNNVGKKLKENKSNWITSTMETERDKRAFTADAGAKLWYLSSSPAFPQNVFICVSLYYSIIVMSNINSIGCICHKTETAKKTQNTRKVLNGFSRFRKCDDVLLNYTIQTPTELHVSAEHNFNRQIMCIEKKIEEVMVWICNR